MKDAGRTDLTVALCAADTTTVAQLGAILAAEDAEVVTVAGEDALMALATAPDVVVLQMPGATRRARAVRRLRAQWPDTQVVVVGLEAKGHEVRSAMEAGAGGFVFAEEAEGTLGLTIRVARAGQIAVPRRERRQVERPTLSYREKQILGLVVMGFMNCEIAERLYLAESTVKSHLSSAFAKLGVRSRNEAVDLILDGQDGMGRGILAITGDGGPPLPSTSAA